MTIQIRILLADDHRVVREGLRSILEREAGIEVVGEAANGREVLELAERFRPDLVLMDVGMPQLNGIEATRRMRRIGEGIRVVALSSHADRPEVLSMFEAGAAAYVLKEAATEEVIAAIRAVCDGRKYLSSGVADVVIDSYVHRAFLDRADPKSALSTREREVVQMVAEGHSAKAIGRRLHLSPSTVEAHRRNVMKKLDLHSIAALTKYAVREGLTEP